MPDAQNSVLLLNVGSYYLLFIGKVANYNHIYGQVHAFNIFSKLTYIHTHVQIHTPTQSLKAKS